MDFKTVETLILTVGKFVSDVKNNVIGYYAPKSLTEATKLTRVEPLAIVSKDLASYEYTADIMQSVLSIFSGYYLQAVSILTKVNNVEVIKILDKLNPDRDESAFLMIGDRQASAESIAAGLSTLVLENYQYTLPMRLKSMSTVAIEAKDADVQERVLESSNLSVGKLLNVDICAGNDKEGKPINVKIPVAVRLSSSLVSNSTMLHLLAYKTEDTGLVERYHSWRAGRISFIRDLIFCQDLIDEYRRAMHGDESGTIQEIIRRVNNSKKYGLLTQNPSLVSASNIFVISENNAVELEQKLGGKLSNKRVRDKAFENTYAMLIVVVDRDYERVTIYSRGIDAATDVSMKEIRQASQKNGIDIGDVLKSMSSGNPVSF